MPYPTKAIANYFIEKSFDTGVELTPMKLLKLVYIAHGWHLGLTGEPLIREAVQAWQYGPVISSLYQDVKRFGRAEITELIEEYVPDGRGDSDCVVPEIRRDDPVAPLLARIWDVYSGFDGGQLSTMTHQPGTPWYEVWRTQGGAFRSGAIIPNDLIREHYRQKIEGAAA